MDELLTFFMGMIPVTEHRGSIPFAIAVLKMAPFSAFFFSILGNIIVALLALYLFEPLTRIFRAKSKYIDAFCEKVFAKTRTQHSHRMSEFGHIALFLFVVFPGSGGYSGALVAYLFGVKFHTAAIAISLGLIVSGAYFTFGSEILSNLFGLTPA